MTRDASKLLEEALLLTPDERAKVAAELLASLEEDAEDIRVAWAAEIARRSADADVNPDDEEDGRAALNETRTPNLSAGDCSRPQGAWLLERMTDWHYDAWSATC